MHQVRLYLAAILCTLSSMQAFAQSNLWQETHAFTFLASGTQSSWSDYLASDQPGVSRIAFGGYDETNALQSWDDALPYEPSPAPKTLPYGDTMQISVKDGYRITGYSLQSNVFSANLVAMGWENYDDVYDEIAPGYANSSATLAVKTRLADGSATGAGQSKTLFNSSGELWVGASGLSLTHDFSIRFDAMLTTDAKAQWAHMRDPDPYLCCHYISSPSLAYVAFQDIMLTIYSEPILSAVPEPQTHAMLLAGLGLIGWRWRRKAAARGRQALRQMA